MGMRKKKINAKNKSITVLDVAEFGKSAQKLGVIK